MLKSYSCRGKRHKIMTWKTVPAESLYTYANRASPSWNDNDLGTTLSGQVNFIPSFIPLACLQLLEKNGVNFEIVALTQKPVTLPGARLSLWAMSPWPSYTNHRRHLDSRRNYDYMFICAMADWKSDSRKKVEKHLYIAEIWGWDKFPSTKKTETRKALGR